MTNKLIIGNKGFIYKQAKFETLIPFHNIIKVVKEIKENNRYDFKIYFNSAFYNSVSDESKVIIRFIEITEEDYNQLIDRLMNEI